MSIKKLQVNIANIRKNLPVFPFLFPAFATNSASATGLMAEPDVIETFDVHQKASSEHSKYKKKFAGVSVPLPGIRNELGVGYRLDG